jgi:glutamyl-tRNA synthetase
MAQAALFLYRDFADYDAKAAGKNLTAAAEGPLRQVHQALAAVPEWQAGAIHEAVKAVAETSGLALGKVAQPLRVAVSGAAVSPPIDVTLKLLGRSRTLARIERALEYIGRQTGVTT